LEVRKEVTGGWRKLYNEKFHNSYATLHQIVLCTQLKREEMSGICRGDMRNAKRILVRKPEKKEAI
jgi:recombinational DNA repair protein RecR